MTTDPRSDAELNRIIAEWMGYHVDGPKPYCTDLNATHEAEMNLTVDQCWFFNRELSKLQGTAAGIGSGTVEQWSWHATARQRAEALVKVIEEEKR